MISAPTISFAGGSLMFTRLPYWSSVRAVTIIILISAAWLFVSAQTKVPLTHETMWMMKRVGAPVPSPGGKWVVFSLVEPAYDEKDQVSDLWIVPTGARAKPRPL